MPNQKSLIWFRNDLRLADNPALVAACQNGSVIPVFIYDDTNPRPLGDASRVWLKQSLSTLNSSLSSKLIILKGNPISLIPDICQQENCQHIYWNRQYDPHSIKRDTELKTYLKQNNYFVQTFQANVLFEPWTIKNKQDKPFKVFTPYYKSLLPLLEQLAPPCKKPAISFSKLHHSYPTYTDDIKHDQYWVDNALKSWDIGEHAAITRLNNFLKHDISEYAKSRDFPSVHKTSRLSPYLHFGEISPKQILSACIGQLNNNEYAAFIRELVWREFSFYLLYHYPDMATNNIKPSFNSFPWQQNKKLLTAWQRGLTGYPIIDAGMRELWQTGYMHNRVRMIVASFLIKNLLIDWREGEAWFWDCLFDADWANNSASWQWVAGSGMDAAPFFRIFNPILQSKKFDADAIYIKKYIPELSNLDTKYIHDPSSAPEHVLKQAGIELDKQYPKAIVDLKATRERALTAYKQLPKL